MDKREKVIEGLKYGIDDEMDEPTCPYYEESRIDTGITREVPVKLLSDALALLKAQEPRVMTLEEVVVTKPGTVVWLEDYDKPTIIPGLVDRVFIMTKVIDFQLVQRTVTADFDEYGDRWRCWTSRPTDAKREAIPWNS